MQGQPCGLVEARVRHDRDGHIVAAGAELHNANLTGVEALGRPVDRVVRLTDYDPDATVIVVVIAVAVVVVVAAVIIAVVGVAVVVVVVPVAVVVAVAVVVVVAA